MLCWKTYKKLNSEFMLLLILRRSSLDYHTFLRVLKFLIFAHFEIKLFKIFLKVKVVPSYTFVRRAVPVRDGSYPEPLACEVGWPVPFLAAFISPVFPLGTHLLLGEQ